MVLNLSLNTVQVSPYFELFMDQSTNIQSVFNTGNISGNKFWVCSQLIVGLYKNRS